mmetsp:Transcript_27703/g.80994  ORF Transcript_27703/g.80994 Transcript_27703/m.80994 type:complete len:292 (-) Transcript_27703:224-1099(-)
MPSSSSSSCLSWTRSSSTTPQCPSTTATPKPPRGPAVGARRETRTPGSLPLRSPRGKSMPRPSRPPCPGSALPGVGTPWTWSSMKAAKSTSSTWRSRRTRTRSGPPSVGPSSAWTCPSSESLQSSFLSILQLERRSSPPSQHFIAHARTTTTKSGTAPRRFPPRGRSTRQHASPSEQRLPGTCTRKPRHSLQRLRLPPPPAVAVPPAACAAAMRRSSWMRLTRLGGSSCHWTMNGSKNKPRRSSRVSRQAAPLIPSRHHPLRPPMCWSCQPWSASLATAGPWPSGRQSSSP